MTHGNSIATAGAGLLSGGTTILADVAANVPANELKAAVSTIVCAVLVWGAQEVRLAMRERSRQREAVAEDRAERWARPRARRRRGAKAKIAISTQPKTDAKSADEETK
jgi:hypothetical protein